MNKVEMKELLEQRIQKRYSEIHQSIKDDILEAMLWATKTLTDKEGSGHCFYITASHSDNLGVVCSFAKPEWAGDHSGRSMDHGAEAVVMAVCEYLEGC